MTDPSEQPSSPTPPEVSWRTELAPGDPDVVLVKAFDLSNGEVLAEGQLRTRSARGISAVTRLVGAMAHPLDPSQRTDSRPRTQPEGRQANSYTPWTSLEDRKLQEGFSQGRTVRQLAATHRRTVGAIVSRLAKLDLL